MSYYNRNTNEYRQWRQAVLLRDGYKCTRCGAETNLEVHHIYPIELFPEMATNIDNGVTLCRKCHYEEEGRFYSEKVSRSCPNLIDNLHVFFKRLRSITYYISYRTNIIRNFWRAIPIPRALRRWFEKLVVSVLLILALMIISFIFGG